MKEVKVIYHPVYLTDFDTAGVESPQRISAILPFLSEHFERVKPDAADEEDILLVHERELVNREKLDRERYETALYAAGGAILCANLALEDTIPFGLIRPPGHHASPDSNWGFCFFNNMAVSIQKLISEKKIERALILDIDLHFGDGTDNFFKDRDDVVVANIQEHDRTEFIFACRDALKNNKPYDIVAVSAGFDRYILDWGQTLETEDYKSIGELVHEYSNEVCNGRAYAILEGGYYIPDLGRNALALISGMCAKDY